MKNRRSACGAQEPASTSEDPLIVCDELSGEPPNYDVRENGEARQRFVRLLSPGLNARSATDLFDAFNAIAILPYEQTENSGTLVLYRPGAALPPMAAQIETPVELRNARCVRKYLHITNGELWLVSDCVSAFGFARPDDARHCAFTLDFRPGGIWGLRDRGALIMTVAAPLHERVSPSLDEESMRRELWAAFPAMSDERASRLCAIAHAATLQTSGTNLLISADARGEARRLGSQCTPIHPVSLGPELIERVTAIDGTVIIDTDGCCHAIGAILDGSLSPRGDRSRGGRYNSAVMYLDTTSIPGVIVVVSKDGTVDVLSGASTEPRP